MKLPKSVRERFRAYGREGGRVRATRLNADARKAVARRAAIGRWVRERFGAPDFAALGLPGADVIDAGLADLANGKQTVESLLVSSAAPRLVREGVPVPGESLSDADVRLYRLLENTHADLAHARYNALRRQVVSFADACAHARRPSR